MDWNNRLAQYMVCACMDKYAVADTDMQHNLIFKSIFLHETSNFHKKVKA